MFYWITIRTHKYYETFEVNEKTIIQDILKKHVMHSKQKVYIEYTSTTGLNGYDNFYSKEFKYTMTLEFLDYYFDKIYTRNNHVKLFISK
jgi:hypothetical protein